MRCKEVESDLVCFFLQINFKFHKISLYSFSVLKFKSKVKEYMRKVFALNTLPHFIKLSFDKAIQRMHI